MKKLLVVGVPLILLLALFLGACSSSSSTGTSSPPGTTSSSTAPGGTTAGQLAAGGQGVFSSICAKCHGANGQGIIGSGQSLDKYKTAQGLYSFISSSMPLNAPGSLSSQQYLEITAYLLLQNSYVSSGQAMDSSSLGSISMTK
jgi:cytochrome c